MNSRERFSACCEREEVDHYFRWNPGFWPTTLKGWRKEGLDTDFNPEKYGRDLDEYFGFDKMVWMPQEIAGACISPFAPRFDEEIIEEDQNCQIIRDGDGIIKKVFKNNEDASMPQFLQFPVKDRATWEKIKPRLELNEELRFRNWGQLKREYGEEGREWPLATTLCGTFMLARNLLGDEKLFYTFFDDPELIHDIEHRWVNLNKAIFTRIATGMDLDLIIIDEDMAYKSGSLISPKLFRKFILPYYKELISYLKNIEIKNIWVDSDGNLQELIPLFLEGGATGIFPFEVQAGNDVRKIHSDFPDKFMIVGGINKRALSKDYGAIEQEVDRVMGYFKGKKGYIPTLDHTVPPDVPLKNFQYYLKCLKQYDK